MPIVKVPENLRKVKTPIHSRKYCPKVRLVITTSQHACDSIPNLPPNLSSMKYLVYDFNVKDIKMKRLHQVYGNYAS